MPWTDAEQPEWQRRLNRFCENWIFAFLVAMAIRHFLIEAFIIPTTSMEPMLRGDLGWFQGDFVAVDKIGHHLGQPKRFDVTVFQVPRDELYQDTVMTRPAVDEHGAWRARPFLDPLVNRNFVKRLLVMPGEDWYIRHGNLYVRPHGSSAPFAVARKPDALQEALWYRTYRSGAQAEHDQRVWAVPAATAAASTVAADAAGVLAFALRPGSPVRFQQPLSNLYLKPAQVRALPPGMEARIDGPVKSGEVLPPGGTVEPERPLLRSGSGQTVDLWDASRIGGWQFFRLKTEDLDPRSRSLGAELNGIMREPVGDWRWRLAIRRLSGTMAWILGDGIQERRLTLADGAWSVAADGRVLGTGRLPRINDLRLAFALVDDQLRLELDGADAGRWEVAPWREPTLTTLAWQVDGDGQAELSAELERDLHWSRRGVLGAEDLANLLAHEAAMPRAEWARTAREVLRMRLAPLRRLHPTIEWPSEVATLSMPSSELGDWLRQIARLGDGAFGHSEATYLTTPPDGCLMLGDNSPHSDDGRNYGYVPMVNVRGRALAVVFPPQRWRVVR